MVLSSCSADFLISLSKKVEYSSFQPDTIAGLVPIIRATSTTGTPDPASRRADAICSLGQLHSILLYMEHSLNLNLMSRTRTSHQFDHHMRSEERRVGKECRSRRERYN